MSVQLYSERAPGVKNGTVQGTRVGGSKPLHRFMKGQPKSVGVVVSILGTSLFITCVSTEFAGRSLWTIMPASFLLGMLLVVCGILYIVTEHFPTEKTVSISLALSIVAILTAFWSIWSILPEMRATVYQRYVDFEEDYTKTETESLWVLQYESMAFSLEAVFVFYSLAAAIILIVMSCMAGAALRSTTSQAIVVMTTAEPGTPAE